MTTPLNAILGDLAASITKGYPKAQRAAIEGKLREEHPGWPNAKIGSRAKHLHRAQQQKAKDAKS